MGVFSCIGVGLVSEGTNQGAVFVGELTQFSSTPICQINVERRQSIIIFHVSFNIFFN